ncbi:response regulator transcription factor [Streptomyces sp. 142MFCol3.1]|uniref:response regulator transcription factor n=1 Tax=Streptomyces sp. 142MFCol3.1 TaxID=1172179 RepID=UPI00040D5D13|nr:helix-turn-helix transcriptional regulator [Streptomyces sp. 142MFCol3.1]
MSPALTAPISTPSAPVPAPSAETSAPGAQVSAMTSATTSEADAPALAPRERETLRHIAAGCTYLQAARQMGLSKHTVDAYLRRIRAKLNITTTAEMTRLAISLGL